MKTWTLPLLFALACIGSSVSAGVEITDLGTLGGQWSDAYAINNFGQVVGLSQTASGSSHTFLYDTGKMIDLYPLNSQFVRTVGPSGINNTGQIASGVIATDGIYSAAVYDSHTNAITLLGSLGGVCNLFCFPLGALLQSLFLSYLRRRCFVILWCSKERVIETEVLIWRNSLFDDVFC